MRNNESLKDLFANTDITVVGHSCKLTFKNTNGVSEDIVLVDDCKFPICIHLVTIFFCIERFWRSYIPIEFKPRQACRILAIA